MSSIESLVFILVPHCVPPTPLSTHQPADNQSSTLTLILPDYQIDLPVARVSDLFLQSYNHALKSYTCSCAHTNAANTNTRTHTYTHAYKHTIKLDCRLVNSLSLSLPPPLHLCIHLKKAHDTKGLLSHTRLLTTGSPCAENLYPLIQTDLFRLIGI